jgi:hypothetical protein
MVERSKDGYGASLRRSLLCFVTTVTVSISFFFYRDNLCFSIARIMVIHHTSAWGARRLAHIFL